MNSIYKLLQELKIEYKKYDHPAVFTVADADRVDESIEGGRTKNLFLRNGTKDKYYLVIVEGANRVEMGKLAANLGEKKLSFASTVELMSILGLTPGSVSPFGLINDVEKRVSIAIDRRLLEYEQLGFHPNINTSTLVIRVSDFQKFLNYLDQDVQYVDL